MKREISSKIDFAVIGFILLVIGIVFGSYLQDKKIINLDPNIKIFEVVTWITTVIVGFYIGFVLKNKTENDKSIKTYLCNDLNDVVVLLKELNQYCYSKKVNLKFEEIERKEVIAKLDFIDKKISSFYSLLDTSRINNKNSTTNIKKILVDCHITLNKHLTGDVVFLPVIPIEFFEETMNYALKYEYEIKIIILDITRK